MEQDQSARTVSDILEEIRQTSETEYEKGYCFEELFMRVARRDPELELAGIWRWSEWPDREALTSQDGRDPGIDLVAQHASGAWIAIQCKCYAESHRVEKKDINAFLAYSQGEPFALRWFVATCPWGRYAESAVRGPNPLARRVDFVHRYGDQPYEDPAREEIEPWPRQAEAIQRCSKGLQEHDRGRLVMACGTGKTFTALRIAEKVVADGGSILFLAPTIALVSQARAEWLRHTKRVLDVVVVCSDATAGKGSEDMPLSELVCPVTTRPARIAKQINKAPDGHARVVFSTYQSLSQVMEAQAQFGLPQFDLTIADEAHRTTGIVRGAGRKVDFQAVHDNSRLRSAKRLYMTATPRIYTQKSKAKRAREGFEVIDMSDEGRYGPELSLLTFKTAVNEGMLSDYRVIVLGVERDRVTPGLRAQLEDIAHKGGNKQGAIGTSEMSRLMGVSLAVNGATAGEREDRPDRLMRTIAFANSIKRSSWYAKAMTHAEFRRAITRNLKGKRSMEIDATHLDAKSSALDRNRELRALNLAGVDERHAQAKLLCNVKLFTEGVNVPALDAVAFLDPRQSQVDIVQAVGRVMRKSPKKRYGYIIVPVIVEPGQEIKQALERGTEGYQAVGKVLRALQSHDGRLAEDTARFVQVYKTNGGIPPEDGGDGHGEQDGQFELELEVGQGIYAHVAKASGLGKPGLLTAQSIEEVVKAAGGTLHREGAANAIGASLGFAMEEQKERRVCTIGALLLTNACLLHRRLCGVGTLKALTKLDDVSAAKAPREMLATAWRAILRQDYSPVFIPGLTVLNALPEGKAVDQAIRRIAERANHIADSLSELGYDHAGPLYHRILGSAKSDGAFYTNNLSALLLGQLALNEDFTDWADPATVRKLRVMDPACGTGTLLMAALKTIKDRVESAAPKTRRKKRRKRREELHRALVEQVLCGMDINRHGVQLAACNLTLGAPTVDYKKMNLHTLAHGVQEDGEVRCGSLEILAAAEKAGDLSALAQPLRNLKGVGSSHVDNSEEADFPLRDLDLVIMNPPFTDNVKRSGKFDPATKKRMQARELWIRDQVEKADAGIEGVITTNSISTFFTPLADRLISRSRGMLARVLPVTACVGTDGIAERKFLAQQFQIELIVTSHDPRQPNFSGETSIHESLLIARRSESRAPTRFVNLHRLPQSADEAMDLADGINSGQIAQWGRSCEWPAERVLAGDWRAALFYNPELLDVLGALESRKGRELLPLGELADVEPAGQRIRDAFDRRGFAHLPKRTPFSSAEVTDALLRAPAAAKDMFVRDSEDGEYARAYPILWDHATEIRQTLAGKPDTQALAKQGKENYASGVLWPKAGRLLLANRFRTNTIRTPAVYLSSKALGSAFVPIRPRDRSERTEKAFCGWLNSTPFVILLLSARSKLLDYPQLSLDGLRSLLAPNPKAVDVGPMADVYEQLKNQELLPWPQMERCRIRSRIDDCVAEILGLDRGTVAEWRRLIATEPTVCNQRPSF